MSSSADEKGSGSNSHDNDSISVYERPKGLRGVYYHPITQIVMLAFVCFLCPGMFNALTGLGGGGQVDPTTSANSTCAVYATYAFFAFFSGGLLTERRTVNNKIGAKRTLLFGTLGYALYVAQSISTLALAGAMMLSYCTEAQKGVFISIFWAIFNLGAVVGATVSFGQNIHSTSFRTIAMIRTDGTRIVMPRHPSWKSEFYGLWVAIITDPMILLLFPMFFASNYFYTWQFNDYNSALFNIRARSLNNFMYWLSQIIGSGMIGVVLDSKRLRRRVRAFTGWGILLVMAFVVHVWAYYYQRTYTRASVPPDSQKMDIYDTSYPAHVWLMIFYGLLDAMWQTTIFWLIGAMSNDTNKLAIYAGFYHSIQSAGAAVVAGLVFSFPMIYLRIRDTTVLEDEGLMQRDQEINDMKAKEMIESGNQMS
ncbi:hypothetical protein EDB19DRAFT_1832168 [Suillus lakei]|nr:hypothetical protein EDB19DRAFT_1832168 [Suillus lakei]